MRPDFIIIGAMKCGTSTLAAQLGAQAGLFMTTPKEPNYFSDDAVYARGQEWYASLFEAAAPGDLKGEASTHYTKRPDLPETVTRMKSAFETVRLIYMIRDPMVRLVSHYIHEWSQAALSEPLETALNSHPALVDYGRYGWQVAPFIEAFGPDAVLLTSLERLNADPSGELSRIAAHIGHEGPVAWVDELEAQNVSAARFRKFPLHGLLISNPTADALRRALIPAALRRWVRERRQISERPEIPSSRRTALEEIYAEDRARLARYFPDDPSLDLAYPFLT